MYTTKILRIIINLIEINMHTECHIKIHETKLIRTTHFYLINIKWFSSI